MIPAMLGRLATLWAFTRSVFWRFIGDGCLAGAGALSYTSLVALVPLTAIALAVLSAFPGFADAREQLLGYIIRGLVPEVGAEVEWWFRYFAGTSARTTTIGVLALAVTAVLMLATIEDQLHQIWRVKSPRPWVQRILAYWAILTLGPLLLGVSFSLPSYIDLFVRNVGFNPTAITQEAGVQQLLRIVPLLLEVLAFTLIYALIPNCSVRWREAAVGGVVAALLIEGLKIGFAIYLAWFSSYRAVYGALAAIPIFLLWMYVAWGAVLFGAVVAAALPRWRVDGQAKDAKPAAHRLGIGLALLAELEARRRIGGAVSTAALAEQLGLTTAAVDEDLNLLRRAGFVTQAADGGWLLGRDLGSATLLELYGALDLPLASSLREEAAFAWQGRIGAAIERIAGAESQALAMTLGELVGAGAPVAPFPARHQGSRS
jgi:membrane protein